MSGDNGLRLALTLADERLERIESYLDQRRDGDGDPPNLTSENEEMRLHADVVAVRETLARMMKEAKT